MGRPTLYNQEMLDKAKHYQENHIQEGDNVPSVEGLAYFLQVGKQTLYNWADEHEEFIDTLEGIKLKQAKMLINGGLEGDYNPTIAKLMLHNHGYSDKQETAISGGVTINVAEDGLGKL